MNSQRFQAEVRKSLSALPLPLPEAELRQHFALQMAQIRLKFPISGDDFAALWSVFEAKVGRMNLVAVLKAIRSACKGYIKANSGETEQWASAGIDEVIMKVRDLAVSMQEVAEIAAKGYFSEDSETWERLKIEEIVREWEGKLVGKWAIALSFHFQWIENMFQERFLPLNFDQSPLEELSFDNFERLFSKIREERRIKLGKELNITFYGAFPRVLLQKYELELDFGLQIVSDQLMKNVFSVQISRVMSAQMKEIASGRLEVRPYSAF